MFKEARIKLTAYYLSILMGICLIFSLVIYNASTADLNRIERFQRFTSPVIIEIRQQIIKRLVYFNIILLGGVGIASYYLAGLTLKPIQENLEEQKGFVANASHQLRTPITALMTELEISLRDPKVKNKEVLESNLEEVRKIKSLTDYLLKQSKFDNLEATNFVKINLKTVAQKAIGKQKVTKNLSNALVLGDETMLIELTTILIDNAKKYGDSKTLPIVSTYKNTLEVRDFGNGIANEDKAHIFEKFYRGKNNSNKDGYGLGLSIAKNIADAHYAKIKVTTGSEGTSFKVVFS